jgi:glycolate oxidase
MIPSSVHSTFTPHQMTELKRLLGPENVLVSPEERLVYSYDGSRQKSLPAAVVLPTMTQDIVNTLRFAAEQKIPVYPRGAGTSLTGAAVPVYGGIVLALTKMNRIIHIDADNLTVTVEPGVVTEELKQAVERHNLYYPPDPASAEFSTIGGNVAAGAGGLRGLKYGVTGDYVLRLEVVRMGGDILHFGAETMKSVSGYDVVNLLIGSEGTLAVFSQITLRLVPKPPCTTTLLVIFDDDTTALETALKIIQKPLVPASLEFMDASAVECAYRFTNKPFLNNAKGLLLIDLDGATSQVQEDARIARELCQTAHSLQIIDTSSDHERKDLWNIRRSLSPALYQIAPSKINQDICVPRSTMLQVLREIKELSGRHKLTTVVFAHAGDGNFHVNFMFDEGNRDEANRVANAVRELFTLTIQHHGTLSGEHGIGTTKAPYLPIEYGKNEIALMRQIKAVWDPDNLLNPGKIFFDPDIPSKLSSF